MSVVEFVGCKMGKILTQASQFLQRGISVIPVRYMDKRPSLATWRDYQNRLPDNTEVTQWFLGDLTNYAVITGWQDLRVIDFDNLEAYARWTVWMYSTGKKMLYDMAYKVQTARGVHVYYRIPNTRNLKLPGIDIQSSRKYIIGPGSIHPTGAQYRALSNYLLFPAVMQLSDILPGDMLVKADLPANIKSPVFRAQVDAWDIADNAAAVSANAITEIKAKNRLEDYFMDKTASDIHGRFFVAKCPFHDDSSPSFWIDTINQIGNCYVCNFPKPLDVINLISRLYGLSNQDAIRQLAKTI